MHRPYRDLQNLKFSCLYLFPFSHKVVPQKASGGRSRGGGGGRIPHFNWSIYRGGNFFFFFFFLYPGQKFLVVCQKFLVVCQKFLVVCLFWGGCHHPNTSFLFLMKFQECTDAATYRSVYNLPFSQDFTSALMLQPIEVYTTFLFLKTSRVH